MSEILEGGRFPEPNLKPPSSSYNHTQHDIMSAYAHGFYLAIFAIIGLISLVAVLVPLFMEVPEEVFGCGVLGLLVSGFSIRSFARDYVAIVEKHADKKPSGGF